MWTIAPAIILVFIAIPSLRLLYLIDEIHNPVITLKTVGRQWYWSYEYSDFTKLEFDSYIVQQEEQLTNTFRLLDTDNRVVLPIKCSSNSVFNFCTLLSVFCFKIVELSYGQWSPCSLLKPIPACHISLHWSFSALCLTNVV